MRTTTVLNDYGDWPHLGQAFRVDRYVTDGSHPRGEVAFGITDLTPDQADTATIGGLVRGHWGIETRLHWVRDVVYDHVVLFTADPLASAMGVSNTCDEGAQCAHVANIGPIVDAPPFMAGEDVHEDRSQVRTENGSRVMATLRNTAISLLCHIGVPNIQRAVRHPQQVARILFP